MELTSVDRVENRLVVVIGEEVLAHVVVGSVAAVAVAEGSKMMHGERTFDRTAGGTVTSDSATS